MDYCFAVKDGNSILYSILAKMISQVPDAAVNAALAYYSANSGETGFIEYITANPVIVGLAALSVVLMIVILVLLFRYSPRKKPANRSQA